MHLSRISVFLAAALLAGCGSMVVNPVTGQSERSVMDESTEIAEGQKAHQQVLQEYSLYPSPAVQKYVNDLGQKLAAQSHRKQLKWHFTVLDSPEINAFALPGGYVYVTRGIMAYMESEADLAGVIGHEIGHVTARHGAQRATTQQTAGIGVFAASILGAVLESQGLPGVGQLAGQVSQTVAAGYVASYGREQELQADGLGAEYLSRTSYDPRNMVDVITVLKNQEMFAADQAKAEGRPAPQRNDWLASHPSNDQRLEMITRLAAQYKGQGNYAGEGRERYLSVMQGVTFGDSPAQGLVRGRNFYHSALGIAISAPEGWGFQNDTDKLTVINSGRDAALVMVLVPPKAGNSHTDIVRNVLKPTQGRAENLSINGLQATRFTGARQNSQGQAQSFVATIVSGPGGNYLMQYNAKDAQALARARSQMQEVEGSFRAMTAQDKAAAKPWVIRSAPYPKGGFAELARQSPLANPEKQLRLMNGYYGGREPKTGQMIKIVALAASE
jgi:predicted Zn-dependent protease